MRKERYKVEDTVRVMLEERRRAHVDRDKQYTSDAHHETKNMIENEVERVSGLDDDQKINLGQRYVDPSSIWSVLEHGQTQFGLYGHRG